MERDDFRILVVDDEEDWVRVNARVLAREGYRVDGAGGGEEALRLAEEGGYHLAFLDIDMPGMDGIELAERLRGACPGIEIVMITGYGTEEKHAAARAKGILDFLQKMGGEGDPVLADEMAGIAAEVFARAGKGERG